MLTDSRSPLARCHCDGVEFFFSFLLLHNHRCYRCRISLGPPHRHATPLQATRRFCTIYLVNELVGCVCVSECARANVCVLPKQKCIIHLSRFHHVRPMCKRYDGAERKLAQILFHYFGFVALFGWRDSQFRVRFCIRIATNSCVWHTQFVSAIPSLHPLSTENIIQLHCSRFSDWRNALGLTVIECHERRARAQCALAPDTTLCIDITKVHNVCQMQMNWEYAGAMAIARSMFANMCV